MNKLKLLVVVPVYNEEAILNDFFCELQKHISDNDLFSADICFVADKCTDNTEQLIEKLVREHKHVFATIMSGRFGHQAALIAGIDASEGYDAIVMMDGDLQHPPRLLPELVRKHLEGFDIVYTTRKKNSDDGIIRALVGTLFYSLISLLSDTKIVSNAADFRLISQPVATVLRTQFPERKLFLRGIFPWLGFNQTAIEYTASQRGAGRSKYTLGKMLQLAIAGLIAFSSRPLFIGVVLSFGLFIFGICMAIWIIFSYLIHNNLPSGWATLVLVQIIFGAMQLFVVGIMSCYVAAVYDEVKRRPRYIIERTMKNEKHDKS
jgi:glycosyltransferase involved in cell wall biosynthesis